MMRNEIFVIEFNFKIVITDSKSVCCYAAIKVFFQHFRIDIWYCQMIELIFSSDESTWNEETLE